MSIDLYQFGKKLHTKLDNGIDQLKSAKAYLESLQKETEAAIQKRIKTAKTALEEKKKDVEAAKERLAEFVEDKTAETQATVSEWKTSRDRKKLEKRAERAQKRAEAFIALALYASEEAEVAILEAVAARKDADEAV